MGSYRIPFTGVCRKDTAAIAIVKKVKTVNCDIDFRWRNWSNHHNSYCFRVALILTTVCLLLFSVTQYWAHQMGKMDNLFVHIYHPPV